MVINRVEVILTIDHGYQAQITEFYITRPAKVALYSVDDYFKIAVYDLEF